MAKKPAKRELVVDQSASLPDAGHGNDGAAPLAAAKPLDLSAPVIQSAIVEGKALIAEGKSKADAARVIFNAIRDESKDVIVAAFVEGATLTPKGALTYWYNCRRKAAKEATPN